MRSQDILKQPEWSNVRALYKSSGYTDEDLSKPIIAVVNSYTSICPGHYNLKDLGQFVREGIRAKGGMPVEFSTIAACDGMAMGHEGMRYILPTRELIANDIEMMVEAHKIDGMVLLGSCDKIIPGMLMAAARLNIPSILLNGGPTLPGSLRKNNPYGGEYIDHSIIQQSLGALESGKLSLEEYLWLEDNAVPTIGSCAMLGTANTMACLSEAMGMSLPGSSTIPAVFSERMRAAYNSGEAIMNLVERQLTPRKIINRESLENTIMVHSGIGGSTNATLHLLAIAYELDIDLSLDDFAVISKGIPHLVSMIPNGKDTLLDFHYAGGIPALMKNLSTKLNLDCLSATGEKIEIIINRTKNIDRDVIHELDNNLEYSPGIAILKGNIAPEGSVTKPSAIPKKAHEFIGPAVIFESELEAIEGIRTNKVKPGDVLVIRNEGPKGGPGMPEMYKPMKMLVGMGLGEDVCVITDGRFSGSNNGCFVGHISPEAYVGGPISLLKNGDTILVDIEKGIIEVTDIDFESRLNTNKNVVRDKVSGYLFNYRQLVSSASDGAIIRNR